MISTKPPVGAGRAHLARTLKLLAPLLADYLSKELTSSRIVAKRAWTEDEYTALKVVSLAAADVCVRITVRPTLLCYNGRGHRR